MFNEVKITNYQYFVLKYGKIKNKDNLVFDKIDFTFWYNPKIKYNKTFEIFKLFSFIYINVDKNVGQILFKIPNNFLLIKT